MTPADWRALILKTKQLSILDIGKSLGIEIRNKQAMCFTGHDSLTPSLSFKVQTNSWRCFGACGKSGDGIQLVIEILGLDFKSAVKWLASEFSLGSIRNSFITVAKNDALPVNKIPHRVSTVLTSQNILSDPEIYNWLISKCGEISIPTGLEYLKSHAISTKVASKFNIKELVNPDKAFQSLIKAWGSDRLNNCGITTIGVSSPKRLIWNRYTLLFPFYEGNYVVYLQGRVFGGRTKYLNLRGVAKPLFNSNKLLNLKLGDSIHICEGVPDAIALESRGLNAVAVLGATSFKDEWVDRFLKFRVVICPDGDKGGQAFEKNVTRLFYSRSIEVETLHVPSGMDVSDVLARIEK